MTIASTDIRADYTGSGITGPYTFSFCLFNIANLEVILTDTLGNDTIQLNTAYSVVGIRSTTDFTQGGTLTFVTAVTTGYHIALISNEDGTQDTSIKNNSEYYAYLHENEFDTLAIKDLQQQEQINKSIKAPDSEPAGTANLSLPHIAIRALSILGFDVNGNVTTTPNNTVPTSVPVSNFWQLILILTTARASLTALGIPCYENVVALTAGTYNDFNPQVTVEGPGWGPTITLMNIDSSGNTTLTGLEAGDLGQRVTIANYDNTMTIEAQNGGSLAANRFLTGVTLTAGESVDLIYSQYALGTGAWVVIS